MLERIPLVPGVLEPSKGNRKRASHTEEGHMYIGLGTLLVVIILIILLT